MKRRQSDEEDVAPVDDDYDEHDDYEEHEAQDAAPATATGAKPVGYFGSRCTPLERNIGYGLAALGVVIAVAGRISDVLDANAKDHSSALPLVIVGVAASLLLALAAHYGRRVITAFAAILPGYFIVPSRSSLAYVQFVFLAFAGWMMVRASNEASRSAAERRKQAGPRMTAAERAEARRAARSGATVTRSRPTPKASKRYTPPKPQKRRPTPPPAAKSKDSKASRDGA